MTDQAIGWVLIIGWAALVLWQVLRPIDAELQKDAERGCQDSEDEA